jgi:L-fuconolactonase
MTIIGPQVHAYEADTSNRPGHSVPNRPPHVTGDDMVATMDTVVVDGAIFISAFDLYQNDASRRQRRARKRPNSGVRRRTPDCN